MNDVSIQDVTSGYRERMRRLALFEPLYELDRMQQKDSNRKPIPMRDFGLLTLLFFFENKLMRNQKVGTQDLAKFLESMTATDFALSRDDYEQIARKLITTFRPSYGKKRETTFFNWETKKEESVQFSYLRDNDFSRGVQYYTLDEDGLELVFATREFYSEFQLSIHQLMLRKQIEKGEFKGALRQINEMRIDVESLYERMMKLEHEIKRNIVSDETFTRYEQLLDDIYARLQRENEEFIELEQFVKETRERLYYEDTDKKERKAYQYALQIAKELESVHGEHGLLLNKCIHLKNHAIKAAHESLYYAGVDSFNFEQDITSRVLSSPAALETMPGLVAPFLPIEQVKVWSPLVILEKQVIQSDDETNESQTFLYMEDEDALVTYSRIQRQAYRQFMELLLTWLHETTTPTLESFITFLKQQEFGELLEDRMFYEFLLVLHHRSPLRKETTTDDEHAQYALGECLPLLDDRTLIVIEQAKVIQVTERYSMQQLRFEWEERHDATG